MIIRKKKVKTKEPGLFARIICDQFLFQEEQFKRHANTQLIPSLHKKKQK